MKARAVAYANIALAKYWGKADVSLNLPAVPSLSVTLDRLKTETVVEFDPRLSDDVVELDGKLLAEAKLVQAGLDQTPAQSKARQRIVELLDRVRELADSTARARVVTHNEFPTAAGLASSASGFAALALAADAALGLGQSRVALSALARRSSASAARSLFGGYVELLARADSATAVAAAESFPLRLLVAVTASGPKSVGSTQGMELTRRTSPYYAAWLESAPRLFEQVKHSVLGRDLVMLGEAMEQSTLAMHATMLTSQPAIVYWQPTTLRVMQAVAALRAGGLPAYFTMDAGPHVKVLVQPERAEEAQRALAAVEGVHEVMDSAVGLGPSVERLA